jgi:hypothetical protein
MTAGRGGSVPSRQKTSQIAEWQRSLRAALVDSPETGETV